MDAKNNGPDNPFADTVHSLEWITCAMEAAKLHKERLQYALWTGDRGEEYRRGPGEAG
jgi:hypothetical protein